MERCSSRGAHEASQLLSRLRTTSSFSLQFFSIILIIFVAEVAAGVVALAYSTFVSSAFCPPPLTSPTLSHPTSASLHPLYDLHVHILCHDTCGGEQEQGV